MLNFFFNENKEKIVSSDSHLLNSRYPRKEAKRFVDNELKKKQE